MFVLANLLNGAAVVLDLLLQFYFFVVIASVIVSWVNADRYNPIVRAIDSMTQPVFYRIRRALPVYAGGIDFSPMIVIVGIYFLQVFLVQSIRDLAVRLH